MQRTRIEWCDYSINPVKGKCPMACTYCYARRMYDRFKWDPEIRYEHVFDELFHIQPSKIFVGSTMEVCGNWVKLEWMDFILGYIKMLPEHTFIFLTKCPQNLPPWSPFPDNCWVGVSATNWLQFSDALGRLATVKASVRFLSFEPLLEQIQFDMLQKMLFPRVIDWLIIGQQTPAKKATMPKVGWIEEIVSACDKAGIPVFLKDNLISCVDQYPFAFTGIWPGIKLRQEFPK